MVLQTKLNMKMSNLILLFRLIIFVKQTRESIASFFFVTMADFHGICYCKGNVLNWGFVKLDQIYV